MCNPASQTIGTEMSVRQLVSIEAIKSCVLVDDADDLFDNGMRIFVAVFIRAFQEQENNNLVPRTT